MDLSEFNKAAKGFVARQGIRHHFNGQVEGFDPATKASILPDATPEETKPDIPLNKLDVF